MKAKVNCDYDKCKRKARKYTIAEADADLEREVMRVGRVRRSAIVNSILTLQAENQKAKAELKQLSEKVKRVKNKCTI